ncbi:MAG: MBL fold metallo-hydrolase [Treponemataceae bacterium]|nr:MBL fold metallo-hydrolase [Treponemataceae bacterium]
MKVYFHMSIEGFSNCYVVVNEETKEAIIIDPGKISLDIIKQIEEGGFNLVAVFITHNHPSHVRGLKTLRRIYNPKVYASDYEVARDDTNLLKGDGSVTVAGMEISYMSVPGHTPDSMVYKIGMMLFTGDCLSACMLGQTDSKYSEKTLLANIRSKIMIQQHEVLIMPGHGPPSTLDAEKNFNISFGSILKPED